MDYGPQTPMNTTTVATAVQRRWACHTRTVLPADAYGRQRCNVVLSACSVVYLWCMSWAVCSLERATKTDIFLPVRTYKKGLKKRNPGNRLIHSRKIKIKRAPATRATVLGSSSNLDDRFRTSFLCQPRFRVLAKSARTKR